MEDVEEIVSTLKTWKTGAGGVLIKILKDFKKSLFKLVSDVINSSFSPGTFPEIIKQAKVIPIFRKGGQRNCNHHRPISLLPKISKIIEKLKKLPRN